MILSATLNRQKECYTVTLLPFFALTSKLVEKRVDRRIFITFPDS